MATASFLSLFTHVRHNELIKRHKHNSLKPDRKQTSKRRKVTHFLFLKTDKEPG